MIPLARPSIGPEEFDSVLQVLSSGQLVQGAEVRAFEEELASVAGTEHAVVVQSGTSALLAALHALGVGTGSTVLVPAYSWVATANVVELLGASVQFVDIDPFTLAMDPRDLESQILRLESQGTLASVRAVLPVHPFGYVADMDAIMDVCAPYRLSLVEDAACALGARLSGRPAGSLGVAGCFSFHPRKVITTGEGGAVVTNDQGLAEHVRQFRNHGQAWAGSERQFVMAGPNLRMTDFQAALGRSQLRRLPILLTRRRALAARYSELLRGLPLTHQPLDVERTSVQSFVVIMPDSVLRGRVLRKLLSQDIEVGTGTIDIPGTVHYSRRWMGSRPCPVSHDVATRALSLPLYPDMDDADVDRVVDALRQAAGWA